MFCDLELLPEDCAEDSGVGDLSLALDSCVVVWCDDADEAVLRDDRVCLGGSGDRAMSSNIAGSAGRGE